MPRQLILGTAGHIDHGKTALVRALTGVDTDRLPQEKQRGITIDIGFASLEAGGTEFGVIDVPGHERFIKNMLAGASGVDVALLVIAADDSIMPQTREHLAILELLGVRHGLIAITKCDLVEAAWQELVEDEIKSLVRGTFLDGAPIVRTSARTGGGLDALRNAIAEVGARVAPPTLDEPFRLGVDRSFVATGLGTVVTGTVWSGSIGAGEEVELLPARTRVRIRGIQSHSRPVELVSRGQRAALNLAGIHHSDVVRGHELATPGVFEPATRLAARLRVLPEAPWPLKHRARVRLHIGAGEVIASVRVLEGDSVQPGETALVEIACAAPVVAMVDQAFVIRAESPLITMGGGRILQSPGKVRRRDASTIERLRAIESDEPVIRASSAIAAFGAMAWSPDHLWQSCRLWKDAATRAIDHLRETGELIEPPGGPLIHAHTLELIATRVTRVLTRLHDQSPLEPRIPRQRLQQSMNDLDAGLLASVIDLLLADARLEGDAADVALPGRSPLLTPVQERVRKAWLDATLAGAFAPPGPAQVATSCAVDESEARRVAGTCARLGELVRITDDIYLHPDRQAELVRRVRDAARTGLTVSQIKDLLGTSRKYAVPICEHLDKLGVTVRRGDLRVAAGG